MELEVLVRSATGIRMLADTLADGLGQWLLSTKLGMTARVCFDAWAAARAGVPYRALMDGFVKL